MDQIFILMYTFTQFLTYDKVIAEASDIPESEFYPDSGEPHILNVYKKALASNLPWRWKVRVHRYMPVNIKFYVAANIFFVCFPVNINFLIYAN